MDKDSLKAIKGMLREELDPIKNDIKGLKEGQNRLENKFGNLEKGQGRLETKVNDLEKGQGRLENKVNDLEEGQIRIETKFDDLEKGQEELKKDVKEIKTIILELEPKNDNRHLELKNSIDELKNNLSIVEIVTASNYADIAKLKNIK